MDFDTTQTAPLSIDESASFARRNSTWAPMHEDEPMWAPPPITQFTCVYEEDLLTQPCAVLTAEFAPLEVPAPIADPLCGEPAYLVEARPPHRTAVLLAVKATLAEAIRAANGVHPSVADVIVREMPLPCDIASITSVMGAMRSWSREADGTWWPPLDD